MSEWDGTGQAYAVSFAQLTAGAVAPLLDAVGARVAGGAFLDVGAGSGVLTDAARARGYDVRATEPEASMRAVLRAAHPDLEVAAAAVPHLPYDDGSFDVVAANFVVNHVADPRASVRELARVTRAGGVVAVTIWPTGASPLRPVWEAMAGAAGAPPLANALPPEHDFPRTEEGLAALLAAASLTDVQTTRPAWMWEVAPGVLWHAVEGGIATIGNIYRRVDPAAQERMRAAFERETGARVEASGLLALPHDAILAIGTR